MEFGAAGSQGGGFGVGGGGVDEVEEGVCGDVGWVCGYAVHAVGLVEGDCPGCDACGEEEGGEEHGCVVGGDD